jgi:hypothetical protein
MAIIGSMYYPDVSFDECEELTRIIYSVFQRETTRQALASHLGHSSNSGRYSSKLSALRQFGLMEGHGTIKLTDLGIKLASTTNPDQRMRWKSQSMLRVPIFHQLYDRLTAKGIETGALIELLQAITGMGRAEVGRAIPSLRKHLDDITVGKQHLEAVRTTTEEGILVGTPDHIGDVIPRTDGYAPGSVQFRNPNDGDYESRPFSSAPNPIKESIHPLAENARIRIEVQGATFSVPFTSHGVHMAQVFLTSLSPQ